IPFFVLPADLRLPVEALIIELSYTLYAFHKPGKIFELRPLVVDSLQRAIDNDGFFYSFHLRPPCCWIVSHNERGFRLSAVPTFVVLLHPRRPEFFHRHARYLGPCREPCCKPSIQRANRSDTMPK